ncbi:nitrilase-related carbon-nitrogen hydrolase [Sorangium sp. So ce1078]|uniref:nitrilase-related carbon-nitrogen hydrolase n=1 Tax=Sorangium sp. So ce1078 TaxID=3133329 RepID=UPI003F6099FA
MRIAVLQANAVPGQVDTNVARIAVAARRAAEGGAHLLVTPELFATGYVPALVPRILLGTPPEDIVRRLAEAASSCGIALVASAPDRGPDGELYIAAHLFDRAGARLATYRKTHLYGPDEAAVFTPGRGELPIVALHGFRLGFLICYDVEFPEAVRGVALAGADLVCAPTALPEPFGVVARTLPPARALESQVYVAYANHCGREGDTDLSGRSIIAAPDGSVLAAADAAGEDLLFAELDPELQRASRADNRYLAERRPDVYAAWERPARTA